MGSVMAGVLLKLLQSMNTDAKVAGEHRSAILQVTSIVPALSGTDLWPNHGFYLQLSDSSHSTFVSLPPNDDHQSFLLSDSPQIGRLVHVDRLLSLPSSPLPIAVGLRPLPSRPLPLQGSPTPLLARFSPTHNSFVIQTAAPHDHPPLPLPTSDPLPPPSQPPTKPRQPSPAPPVKRAPSPASKSRTSSPAPSRCEVPSLVAAREENRRSSREPSIVVPSRYRQPSPRRGAASPRRGAASPSRRTLPVSPAGAGRRLSGVLRVSPLPASAEKRKSTVVVAGISKISDALSSSGRPGRKSWDGGSSEHKGKASAAKGKPDKDAILRTQVAMSRRLSDASSKHSSEENISKNEKPKKSDGPSSLEKKKSGSFASKITVHDRKWTDGSISFDPVSDNLAKIGKESIKRRNAAFAAATEALEEASATESLVRNLSMFCELCNSSKVWRPLPTIDRFLSLYSDVLLSTSVVDSLASHRASNPTAPSDHHSSISLWLEAALATDLQVVSLLSSPDTELLPILEKSSQQKQQQALPTKRHSLCSNPHHPSKTNNVKSASSPRLGGGGCTKPWSRGGCGVGENVELARTLCVEMEEWFVRFVEQALESGFQLGGGGGGGGVDDDGQESGKVAAVLSQLKKVNTWLDGVRRKREEAGELVEKLKRKIYGFVVRNVGNAFESSVAISL